MVRFSALGQPHLEVLNPENPSTQSCFSIPAAVSHTPGSKLWKSVNLEFCSGYDPNGDYTYTKGQHYGAEEWRLTADENDTTGRRAVVIFAVYGRKYLAIRQGALTGVTEPGEDCRWYLD